MNRFRFKVRFEDRVGMVRDVAEVVSAHGANILSLEVRPGEMHIQIDHVPSQVLENILRRVGTVANVLEVAPVELLPHELAQQRLRAIFDAVEEGILVTDAAGTVALCNRKAQEILGMASSLVGTSLKDLGFPKEMLVWLALGRLSQQEALLSTPHGRLRCLVKSQPLVNEEAKPAGAMITIQKMSQVRRLVQSLTQPVMVTFDEIIYTSKRMAEVVNFAKAVARSDSTILIRGESGTGKELFARAIHMASPRRDNPFGVVNCAAIPDTLLESELFGYADGTFTGALKGGRQGLFEFAHQGTVFLDEIAEIPPYVQVKLLRVLQDGCVRRLGEMVETKVDVRVIAATSRNLEQMVAEGSFREDLFYRLNVIPLNLPPLRERKEDIPVLAKHFIEKFNQRLGKDVRSLSDIALKRLWEYDWPGNVRELENVIERAMNLCSGQTIDSSHIILPSTGKQLRHVPGLKRAVEDVERQAILEALNRAGSIRKAAEILGVSHTTIINKMRRYRISGKTQYHWK
ncbi:MAG: sigma 54-interacting transcriptional regulator [Bacillota bacterium]